TRSDWCFAAQPLGGEQLFFAAVPCLHTTPTPCGETLQGRIRKQSPRTPSGGMCLRGKDLLRTASRASVSGEITVPETIQARRIQADTRLDIGVHRSIVLVHAVVGRL